ncbi:hypothetical protein FRB90_000316 [Tulasnella sp. 427]|nr:hypothetical protein FRB90_000316 [Tulasnella sp. 427]
MTNEHGALHAQFKLQVAAIPRLDPLFRFRSMTSRLFRYRPSTLLRPQKSLQPAYCSRRITSGTKFETIADEDDDLLDISTFGSYSLVLPEDPYREGVDHLVPAVVPHSIRRPPYAISGSELVEPVPDPAEDLEMKHLGMRHAGLIAALALRNTGQIIKPGVTTKEINDLVHETILNHRAYPSPLLYKGFPMSCCTSVNNVLAHGIPDERPLEDGDIVNVDVTVYKDGWHGDTSKTFLVGNVDQQGVDLIQATEEALLAGIKACGPGVPFREIGRAIVNSTQRYLGISVSPDFLGHGIGRNFHQAPWISHTESGSGEVMKAGDFFTIEPVLVQGTDPSGWLLPDGWTVLSETGGRGAQAEHTIGITENGAQIMTTPDTTKS